MISMRNGELIGKPKIVCVVGGKDYIKNAKEAKGDGADLLELRLDLFDDDENYIKYLKNLKEVVILPVITTIRRTGEGGLFIGNREERRKELFLEIIKSGKADALDIELNADKIKDEIIEKAKEAKITVITSYHNYLITPSFSYLERIFEKAKKIGDICKIAVMGRIEEDVKQLLRFTLKYKDGHPLVTISMGEAGKISRILAPFYGSRFTYGYCGRKSMAPGQITIKEIKATFKHFESISLNEEDIEYFFISPSSREKFRELANV